MPPQALLDYVLPKGLHRNGVLPQNFCKLIESGLEYNNILEITHHKKNGYGKIEVLCQYSDGDKTWQPLEYAKKDVHCKVLLGAYAWENNLYDEPGWEDVDGYWLEAVHDIMCTQRRSNEIIRLVVELHRLYEKRCDEFGGNETYCILFGRAWKQSLEIEKHGGKIKLPLYLYNALPETLHDHLENIE